MSLLLANILSTLMALGSLGAFIIVGREANETIKLGKLLTLRMAATSHDLERVAKSLQNQRTDLADETVRLESRLAETARVRREMDEAIEELSRVRKVLSRDVHQAHCVTATVARIEEQAFVPTKKPAPKEKNTLPVFVRRAIKKATVEIAGQA